jgi:hypothetical protein
LARRLRRCGLGLPAGLVASLLSQQAAAAVPASLAAHTIEAAANVAAGKAVAGLVSAPVAALTEGVIRAMFLTKFEVVTAWLLAFGLLFGAGVLGHRALADKSAADKPSADKADKKKPAADKPATDKPINKGDKKGRPANPLEVHAVIVSVESGRNTLTVMPFVKGGEPRTYALASDAKIYLEEGKKTKGQKPPQAKLTDLSEGVRVVLKLSADKKTVERINARGPLVTGVLKRVDATKKAVTVAAKTGERTFSLADDVHISMAFGIKGFRYKVADLRPGMSVALDLTVDKTKVRSVTAFRPTVQGSVSLLDPGKNIITIGSKGKGGLVEKTYELGKDLAITLPSGRPGKLSDISAGMYVLVELSPDGKTAERINPHRPSLHGSIKAVNAAKSTITISYKSKDGLQDMTFALAKDVPIQISDAKGARAKLADLPEGAAVVATLSLDKQSVRQLTVYGPTFTAVVKSVDEGSHTITVAVKEEGGLVEKTLEVAKDARISLGSGKTESKAKLTELTEGMLVAVRLSVDKAKVVELHARKKK